MSKKDFRLVRPVKDAYSTREVGYEDTFDYPNLYNEETGEVGICGGHGIYAWAKREDYELINQRKDEQEKKIDAVEELEKILMEELEKIGATTSQIWKKKNQNKDDEKRRL